jgi:hypothetical protein
MSRSSAPNAISSARSSDWPTLGPHSSRQIQICSLLWGNRPGPSASLAASEPAAQSDGSRAGSAPPPDGREGFRQPDERPGVPPRPPRLTGQQNLSGAGDRGPRAAKRCRQCGTVIRRGEQGPPGCVGLPLLDALRGDGTARGRRQSGGGSWLPVSGSRRCGARGRSAGAWRRRRGWTAVGNSQSGGHVRRRPPRRRVPRAVPA